MKHQIKWLSFPNSLINTKCHSEVWVWNNSMKSLEIDKNEESFLFGYRSYDLYFLFLSQSLDIIDGR